MTEALYEISNAKLYLIMLFMLVTGTANTIVLKLQDKVVVGTDPETGKDMHYHHPYFQCANMFVGEFCCIFIYLAKSYCGKQEPKENETKSQKLVDFNKTHESDDEEEVKLKTSINILWLAFPAIFDCIGCTLMYIALTDCAASVYQMMRGIIVVITAGLSVTLLKRKQYLHHWVSLLLIVLGVASVGFVGIIESKNSDQQITTVGGIILLLLSQLFISLQLITEEKILHGYSLDPFFLVGMEGFWGLIYFAISLPILQHIQVDGKPVEDTMLAFRQLGDHKELLIEALCIVVSIGSFNICGISVTKYGSAA